MQKPQGCFQPPGGIQHTKELRLIREFNAGILGNAVGKEARVRACHHLQIHRLGRVLRHLQIQPIQGICLPPQGLRTNGVRLLLFRNRFNGAKQVRLRLRKLGNLSPADARHQHTQIFRLGLEHLLDLRHRTDGIQVGKLGIVHQQILLGHQKNRLVNLHRRFQRQNGLGAANIKVHRLVGEHRQAPQGQNGQLPGIEFFFIHEGNPSFRKKGGSKPTPLPNYFLPVSFCRGCAASRTITGSPPSTDSGVMTIF